MKRSMILGFGVAVSASATAYGLSAQQVPPRPVSEMVAEFVSDPSSNVRTFVGPCPGVGTWRMELLNQLLLEISPAHHASEALINSQSYNVQHCGIPTLDAWYRRALWESPIERTVYVIAGALWSSNHPENRAAVLEAMFDPALGERRDIVADQVASSQGVASPVVFLRLISEGYEKFGQAPPPLTTMQQLRRAGSTGEGRLVKEELLESWKQGTASPGSLVMIALLVNDAALDGDNAPTAWGGSVLKALEGALAGSIPVSEDILQELTIQYEHLKAQGS